MNKLHSFYTSKPWKDLSYKLKMEAHGKCFRCDFQVIDQKDYKYLIGHHKIELTEENVDDPYISLNPENIEIICIHCHNDIHKRFGYKQKVYIVYGPPLSGKSTFVNQVKNYGDIVLDIDNLWQAVSGEDRYIKPDNIRFNIFKLRDELLDQIKTRYGKWNDAYIVGGYPEKYERERLAKELGAECIFIEATKDSCLEKAKERPSEWKKYIEDWFDMHNG